jgi:hypothetical protein
VYRVALATLAVVFLSACAATGSASPETAFKPMEIAISLAGLAGAGVAFVFGLRQYRRSEQWKRAEFVSTEMKEFFANDKVLTAMTLIDWGGRYIRLSALQDPANRSRVYVDRRMQCFALLPHTVIDRLRGSDVEAERAGAEQAYSEEHTIIRDCFDAFFDGLERFGSNVQSRLVTKEELLPYIRYWVDDIASDTNDAWDATWTACVFLYIHTYGYTGVQRLFKEFGHDISIDGKKFQRFLNAVEDQMLARLLKQGVSDAPPPRAS